MDPVEYTTQSDIENYLLTDIDGSFSEQIASWIVAMSNFIDNYCNRSIYRTEEETFLYDGDNTDKLMIKDVCLISSVTVDDIEVEYVKYPANKPYASRIRLIDNRFTTGIQNVSVTGIQAMNSTLPEDIKFACTVLVAGIVNNQLFNDKKGTTERIGGYSITYKDDQQQKDYEEAKRILAGYTRITF